MAQRRLYSSPTYLAWVRFSTRGHVWVKLFAGSLLYSERFFCGFSGFPLSSKINISKFHFNRMQDLPESHFQASGASRVNITNKLILITLIPQGSDLSSVEHYPPFEQLRPDVV